MYLKFIMGFIWDLL